MRLISQTARGEDVTPLLPLNPLRMMDPSLNGSDNDEEDNYEDDAQENE